MSVTPKYQRIMEHHLGYIFTEICTGSTKSATAISLGMNKCVLGRNLKKFKLQDRKEFIDLVINELKDYRGTLK